MPTLFKSCLAAGLVLMIYSLASPPLPCAKLFPYFLGGLFLVFSFHQTSAWLRRADNHSFSTGRTRLRLPIRDSLVHRYLEPIACFGLGAVLVRFDPLLGAWLLGAAVSIFVEEQIARVQGRKRLLDTLDGRWEARTLQTALQSRLAPPQTESSQTPVAIAVKRRRGKMPKAANLASRLDPALRRIVEAEKDVGGSP